MKQRIYHTTPFPASFMISLSKERKKYIDVIDPNKVSSHNFSKKGVSMPVLLDGLFVVGTTDRCFHFKCFYLKFCFHFVSFELFMRPFYCRLFLSRSCGHTYCGFANTYLVLSSIIVNSF